MPVVYADAGIPVTARRFRDLLPPTVALRGEKCGAAYSFVDDAAQRPVLAACSRTSAILIPLLRRLDRTSMGASIECRVPLLDPRLVHIHQSTPRLPGRRPVPTDGS